MLARMCRPWVLVCSLVAFFACATDEDDPSTEERGTSYILSDLSDPASAGSPMIAANAHYVVFESRQQASQCRTPGTPSIEVDYRGVAGTMTNDGEYFTRRCINRGNRVEGVEDLADQLPPASGAATEGTISADGQRVAFTSSAPDLPAMGATNTTAQIFLSIRRGFGSQVRFGPVMAGYTMKRITPGTSNEPSGKPAISGDGRWIAFESAATNLVPNDNNGQSDVFLVEIDTGAIERVTDGGVELASGAGNPAISNDGRFVAFTAKHMSTSTQVWLYDRTSRFLEKISVGSDGKEAPDGVVDGYRSVAMSGNGLIVAFASVSPLVSGDSNKVADVFVRDRKAKTTQRASQNKAGVIGDGESTQPSVSFDGNYVAFTSKADNIGTTKDTNRVTDTYVFNRTTKVNWRSSVTHDRLQANGASSRPWVAFTAELGLQEAYQTDATNIDTIADTNTTTDVGFWNVAP